MYIFSRSLGDAVKQARTKSKSTQSQIAEQVGIDSRTIMNIENYKANPKMKILYPLIRHLIIDPREIFNPEMQRKDPMIQQLRFLIEDCSEQEAAAMIPVIEAVLTALRNGSEVKEDAPT